MFVRIIVVGMAVFVTVPLAAQQAAVLDNHSALKSQVRFFETVVQAAVRRGGEMLQRRAQQIEKRVELVMDGLPVVSGVYLPEQGYYFDVQIPDIGPTALSMWMYLQQPRPGAQARPLPPAPQVSTTPNRPVQSTGIPQDDPNTEPFDLPREYGNFVKVALVDAMLDASGALPVKAGERLTVRARVPQVFIDPRALGEERELLLTVGGEDLLAFRQGELTRADLQKRVREFRY